MSDALCPTRPRCGDFGSENDGMRRACRIMPASRRQFNDSVAIRIAIESHQRSIKWPTPQATMKYPSRRIRLRRRRIRISGEPMSCDD